MALQSVSNEASAAAIRELNALLGGRVSTAHSVREHGTHAFRANKVGDKPVETAPPRALFQCVGDGCRTFRMTGPKQQRTALL